MVQYMTSLGIKLEIASLLFLDLCLLQLKCLVRKISNFLILGKGIEIQSIGEI